jgi:hypothetical protein
MMEQPAQFTLRTFERAPPIGRQVLAGPIDEKVEPIRAWGDFN